MTFNSLTFALFLPIVLGVYYLLTRKAQNYWLLAASCVFYGWWDSRFLILLAFSTTVDYCCASRIARSNDETVRQRFLLVSLVSNLGILGFFKYFNFFVDSTHAALVTIGWRVPLPALEIILPVGISFYTFQAMSYTIDVFRRTIPPCRDFVAFALSVCYFPHLVAGPIQRTAFLLPQLEAERRVRWIQIREGAGLIIYGFFKKVGVADAIAPAVSLRFANPQLYGWSDLLFALYLFSIQIYCDFSGYSDIARGTSKLFGIELMLNFDHPYFSQSITEFWRRWHISLSTWLREYLYIPLGGNRRGVKKTYRNLLLTMLLGGLWHGASWTFVVWGGLHGAYLALHKMLLERRARSTATARAIVGEPASRSPSVVPMLEPMFAFAGTVALWVTGKPSPPVRMVNTSDDHFPGDRTLSPVASMSRLRQAAIGLPITSLKAAAIRTTKVVVTFHLVCLAWIFFRAESFSVAWSYLSGILTMRPQTLEPLNWLGMRTTILLATLLGIDLAQYWAGRQTMFLDWNWTARAALYAGLIVVMLVCGELDADVPFIYFQF